MVDGSPAVGSLFTIPVLCAVLSGLAWFFLALSFYRGDFAISKQSSIAYDQEQTEARISGLSWNENTTLVNFENFKELRTLGSIWLTALVLPPSADCTVLGLKDKIILPANQYHPAMAKEENMQSKCRSRYEQHCFWQASDYKPSPEFLDVLREYEKYHRDCVQGHDLLDLNDRGSVPKNTSCKYVIWSDMDGNGNQLISLVSAFLYGLMTGRVLLMTPKAQLQYMLCEPFPFSSWLAPEGIPHASERYETPEERHSVFYEQALQNKSDGKPIVTPKHLVVMNSHWIQPDDLRFFCQGEQKLLDQIPWLYFWSNNYIAPGYYFLPNFRTKLNKWFPDRALFLHAGRYLLSPRDEIWERVLRFYYAYLDFADRRVGIQVRSWDGNYDPVISEHIMSCGWRWGLLPKLADTKSEEFRDDSGGERISVVVTSLRREYAEGIVEVFANNGTVGHETVTVLNPSSEGYQMFGQIDHDRKAISEIWLLSFTEQIISTPKSTFGYVAHGLAGRKPFVFNKFGGGEVPDPPCLESNMPGPCFINHPHNMLCPLDGPSDGIGDSFTVLPEVRHCLLQWGIGVVER
ncbi:hypothetical protein R1sor_017942 [Riccia sorocarpa]|uniref:Fucosyltransferase n=1 Tax=Riccia sorocarpa TaxID=122646 RepID=A0ABD3IBZ8_9MARC